MNDKLLENKTVFYVDQIRNLENGGFEPPVTFEIDPSNACPLNCEFCMFSERDKKKSLSWDSYCWLLDEMKAVGVKSITFTGGGEPLCNTRINSMIERARTYGFKLGLVTNGVFLDKVERPDAFTFIRVSLDAGTAEVYKTVKRADLFDRVIDNVSSLTHEGVKIGLSFVVTPNNKHTIDIASTLAKEIGVMYIQFKPDSRFGEIQEAIPDSGNTIKMRRFKAPDTLPCKVASLIGICGADEKLYFCCQYRGEEFASYGKLRERPLIDMLKSRDIAQPDISKCPYCRYMNYVYSYKQLTNGGLLFYDHRDFL